MKWLTIKEVKQAAKKSKRDALRCSRKHWRQNWMATKEELKRHVIKKGPKQKSPTDQSLCALCTRYFDRGGSISNECKGCPHDERGFCCLDDDSLYGKADDAFVKFFSFEFSSDSYDWCDPTDEQWDAWQAAAKDMYDALKE